MKRKCAGIWNHQICQKWFVNICAEDFTKWLDRAGKADMSIMLIKYKALLENNQYMLQQIAN